MTVHLTPEQIIDANRLGVSHNRYIEANRVADHDRKLTLELLAIPANRLSIFQVRRAKLARIDVSEVIRVVQMYDIDLHRYLDIRLSEPRPTERESVEIYWAGTFSQYHDCRALGFSHSTLINISRETCHVLDYCKCILLAIPHDDAVRIANMRRISPAGAAAVFNAGGSMADLERLSSRGGIDPVVYAQVLAARPDYTYTEIIRLIRTISPSEFFRRTNHGESVAEIYGL